MSTYRSARVPFLACVLFAATAALRSAAGATIYVNAAATGAGIGTSWADAFTTIQPALTAAVAGDEIWVAVGTYKPTAGADRNATFQLKSGVALRGGFLGTESMPSQRPADPDPQNANPANDSVLSGDVGAPGFGDNSFRVVTANSVSAGTLLDRFVVTNGESTTSAGAGLTNNSGSPTIQDCLFLSNTAITGGGLYSNFGPAITITRCVFKGNTATPAPNGRGGAVHILAGGPFEITDSIFLNNNAAFGGGALYHSNASGAVRRSTFMGNGAQLFGGAVWNSTSTCLIEDSVFTSNTTTPPTQGNGGAIANTNSSNTTVQRSTFTSNAAREGGAVSSSIAAQLTMSECVFQTHSGALAGGAVHLGADGVSAAVTNCVFTNNSVIANGVGGAISSSLANAMVRQCMFTGNGATRGGAIQTTASMTIRECVIRMNSVTGGSGGGLQVDGGSPTVVNCAFAGNTASGTGAAIGVSNATAPKFVNCLLTGNNASSLGGGVHTFGASVNAQFINCTVAANSAGNSGGGFSNTGSATTTLTGCIVRANTAGFSDPQVRQSGAAFNVSFSNIQGGWVGTGNIDADPLFLNPADADGSDNTLGTSDDGFTVLAGSPCLDAASNPALEAALPAGVVVELSGFSRFRDDPAAADTGLLSAMNPGIADMGAYERQPPPVCPGDADGDGSVGLGDVAVLIQHWDFTVTPGTDGDLDFNGTVNLADLAIVIINWTLVCD